MCPLCVGSQLTSFGAIFEQFTIAVLLTANSTTFTKNGSKKSKVGIGQKSSTFCVFVVSVGNINMFGSSKGCTLERDINTYEKKTESKVIGITLKTIVLLFIS